MEHGMDTNGFDDSTSPVFVGTCRLLRAVPRTLSALAVLALVTGNLVGALLVGAAGLLVAALLPWRFAVFDEGVLLSFTVREDRFFSKHDIAIRSDETGAVLYPTASARRGYALCDGVFEHRRDALRAVLVRHGFRLA
jgi:hypothetical protein